VHPEAIEGLLEEGVLLAEGGFFSFEARAQRQARANRHAPAEAADRESQSAKKVGS
jgi:hypothetical protein